MKWRLFLGDSSKVLRSIPDNEFDSLVCDPPSGISFMGKNWDHDHGGRDGWIDAFANIFGECLRVLKPGAHGLVWALPRTAHWTATALEDAGFELREIIVHLYGTGFPKSLSVQKALEKQGHPDAEKYSGVGTALKPASEHWIMVRKPLGERTVAANVLEYGTGGLNIDAARIGTTGRPMRIAEGIKGNSRDDVFATGSGQAVGVTSNGRFPANLVLSHAPECRRVGEKSVMSNGGSNDLNSRLSFFSPGGKNKSVLTTNHRDPDGTETVADWECAPGCPVKELDEQSGELKSGSHAGYMRSFNKDGGTQFGIGGVPINWEGDSGGASRFFRQFDGNGGHFKYQAKARNREKWFFCKDCKEAFQVKEKKDHQHDHADKKHLTQHPTPKSLGLMRYFVKLITPPQGVVLDPFAGTGSTGVACLTDDFRFVGIEMDPEYHRIAKRRMMEAMK